MTISSHLRSPPDLSGGFRAERFSCLGVRFWGLRGWGSWALKFRFIEFIDSWL